MRHYFMRFVLATAMIMIFAVATATIAEPRLSYIADIDGTLSLSGSNAKASGYIIPQDYTSRTTITVKLQRRNEVGKWITVATWTNSGIGKVSAGGTREMDGRSSYRAYAVGKVLDSNANTLETATDYSSVLP